MKLFKKTKNTDKKLSSEELAAITAVIAVCYQTKPKSFFIKKNNSPNTWKIFGIKDLMLKRDIK
ncbi:MAG: hypothetical protein ACPLYC_01025 [Minisyncoccia bacterium]